MIIKTNALVIKEQDVGESDRLVTLLTQTDGIIRAFARKAKSLKDSKNSSTSILTYSKFSIYKGKDKYIIDSASPIEVFFELRHNIEALTLAQYFCELSNLLIPEQINSSDILKVVLNSIYFLTTNKKSLKLIKAITEIKLCCLSGYMPDLVACKECVCYESNFWNFLIPSSRIICSDCLLKFRQSERSIRINHTVLTSLRFIIYSDINKIYSFNIPENDIKSLSSVCEQYILSILEKVPFTLEFFKNITED